MTRPTALAPIEHGERRLQARGESMALDAIGSGLVDVLAGGQITADFFVHKNSIML